MGVCVCVCAVLVRCGRKCVFKVPAILIDM